MPRSPAPPAPDAPGLLPTQPLAWGAVVSPAFRARVYALCVNLGWTEDHASWLMACMAFETGRTFSPSVRHPRGSATGLIQFLAGTAKALGTSTTALSRMTGVEQLAWVEKYFQAQASRIRSLDDLYMAILWPAAVGKHAHQLLWPLGFPAYAANRGLDANRDARITVGEAAAKPRALLAEGLRRPYVWLPEAR